MTRADRRLLLGDAAVLTVAQAAALLPVDDNDARRWLRNHGLIARMTLHDPETGIARDVEVVVWGDVVDALARADAHREAATPRQIHGNVDLIKL